MAGRYRPALPPSGKARCMTRQIALGAVIAFAVTVLALSVWEPKAPVAVAPPPPVAAIPAVPMLEKPIKSATLRPDGVGRAMRAMALQPMTLPVDAGAPAP